VQKIGVKKFMLLVNKNQFLWSKAYRIIIHTSTVDATIYIVAICTVIISYVTKYVSVVIQKHHPFK